MDFNEYCFQEINIINNKIIGHNEEIEYMNSLISMIIGDNKDSISNEKKKFLNLNGNILLFGKPGTGKSSIAYEFKRLFPKATFYNINISSLISEKLGKSEKNISCLFENLIEECKQNSTIILFEEIEAFLPNRTSDDLADMKRALTVFMYYLDQQIDNLIIICTTNHKNLLDPAILRRFSLVLEISSPNIDDIKEFFNSNPFSEELQEEEIIERIAKFMVEHGLTISQLKTSMKKVFLKHKKICSAELLRILQEDYKNE